MSGMPGESGSGKYETRKPDAYDPNLHESDGVHNCKSNILPVCGLTRMVEDVESHEDESRGHAGEISFGVGLKDECDRRTILDVTASPLPAPPAPRTTTQPAPASILIAAG